MTQASLTKCTVNTPRKSLTVTPINSMIMYHKGPKLVWPPLRKIEMRLHLASSNQWNRNTSLKCHPAHPTSAKRRWSTSPAATSMNSVSTWVSSMAILSSKRAMRSSSQTRTWSTLMEVRNNWLNFWEACFRQRIPSVASSTSARRIWSCKICSTVSED